MGVRPRWQIANRPAPHGTTLEKPPTKKQANLNCPFFQKEPGIKHLGHISPKLINGEG
jgi:hypothetical protein